MKCNHTFRNGRRCRYIVERDSKFCYVHKPGTYPVFFIKDCQQFKGSSIVSDLSLSKANEYISKGVALKLDYKMKIKIEKAIKMELLAKKKRLECKLAEYDKTL
jgi:hypothetical protein